LKRLIITGDDFGASSAVNEAIEQAHRQGILNTASLMVGAEAAEDAVRRAQRLPELRVGLHLVLVCGKPVLPAAEIPGLVDAEGALPSRLGRAGVRFFFLPRVRRQLAAEIRAQFAAFQATGLALDHVNAHNHMHLHPTVLGLVLRIGAEFGLRAVRLPHEPFLASWRATREGLVRRAANDLLLWPLLAAHRARLARAGMVSNDYVFGMNDTGTMDRNRLLGFLAHLPDGISEIYCHPATEAWPGVEAAAQGYRFAAELAALTDAAVAAAIPRLGIQRTAFGRLATDGAP
jgi:hopanoid biosynthesis associated protein HpnK